MENTVTKIDDLPFGNNNQNGPSNNVGPQTISISEMKKKPDNELPTNYTPINVHPNPYGVSAENPIRQNPQMGENQQYNSQQQQVPTQVQTVGMPDEFREQIQNMPPQQLPSRDIPMKTDTYTIDEQVKTNYIPKPKIDSDYVREHYDMTEQNLREYESKRYRENKLDDFLSDFQTPLFVAILYFFFQLPVVNTMIFKRFSFLSIYGEDGNFNFNGLLLKSLLFGNIFYSITKIVNFISNI